MRGPGRAVPHMARPVDFAFIGTGATVPDGKHNRLRIVR